jgi:hypothetical protein
MVLKQLWSFWGIVYGIVLPTYPYISHIIPSLAILPFGKLTWLWSGWWYTYPSEKYEFVNGKDYPIYEMENKPCLKLPTRIVTLKIHLGYPFHLI